MVNKSTDLKLCESLWNREASQETTLTFQAEILSPDGGSDSFWVQIKGSGSPVAWHAGIFLDWAWSSNSPQVTAPVGESIVQFYGRETDLQVRLGALLGPCHTWMNRS